MVKNVKDSEWFEAAHEASRRFRAPGFYGARPSDDIFAAPPFKSGSIHIIIVMLKTSITWFG